MYALLFLHDIMGVFRTKMQPSNYIDIKINSNLKHSSHEIIRTPSQSLLFSINKKEIILLSKFGHTGPNIMFYFIF